MKIDIRPNWIAIPSISIGVMLVSRLLMMGNWQWYTTLKLPSITPSALFIGGVWQCIYLCSTGCLLLLYNFCEHNWRFWVIMSLFGISTLFNLYWIYLFFHQHYIGWSVFNAVALSASVWALMFIIWPLSRFCAVLLVPYAAWTSYMTLLNMWTWFIN
jgi:benzodiazapine receptor